MTPKVGERDRTDRLIISSNQSNSQQLVVRHGARAPGHASIQFQVRAPFAAFLVDL